MIGRQSPRIQGRTSKIEILLKRLKDGLDARLYSTVTRVSHICTGGEPQNNCSTSASRWCPSTASSTACRGRSSSTQGRISLIAQIFIIQSESDQQRERLISGMSLRNITLDKYSFEMLKTQCHDLFLTTRTSIQDLSRRKPKQYLPHPGKREGEEGF